MIKHYVQFMYPGMIMAETSEKLVDSRKVEGLEVPESAYAFQFFSRTEVEEYGEKLVGEKRDGSGTYYIGGRIITLEEARTDPKCTPILIGNMECNKWDRVIECKYGNMVPFDEGDQVVDISTLKVKIRARR